MNLSYLSVCSGIEAATVAWHPLGWKPWAFSQFDPEHKGKGDDFASAVLRFHYPDVPNFGDMTKFEEWPQNANLDVLVGGTPCQSYSVAGLRKGLDDPRGDLMLTYVAIARRYRPKWVVWENVPGVLSDDAGRSFGSLLGLLSGRRVEVPSGGWETAGFIDGYKGAYGLAWRVLDTQFVRVDGFGRARPQRRRRVFVVGYLGDWRRAAAVLLELESLSGNPPPRRSSGQGVAPTISARTKGGGGLGTDFDCDGGLIPETSLALTAARGASKALDTSLETYIPETAPTLSESSGHARPGDNIQSVGYLIPEIANPLTARMFKGVNTTMDEGQTMIGEVYAPDVADPLVAGEARTYSHSGNNPRTRNVVAFSGKDYGGDAVEDVAPTLREMGHGDSHANGGGQLAVAFQPRFARNGRGAPDEVAAALTGEAGRTGKGDSAQCVAFQAAANWRVRRLTPTECERLQGFPDGYTNIPWRGKNGAPDGPRYKVLGNSMSCNVMRWLGRRIEMVEKIIREIDRNKLTMAR